MPVIFFFFSAVFFNILRYLADTGNVHGHTQSMKCRLAMVTKPVRVQTLITVRSKWIDFRSGHIRQHLNSCVCAA